MHDYNNKGRGFFKRVTYKVILTISFGVVKYANNYKIA